jgi:type II secretory pathway component PulL
MTSFMKRLTMFGRNNSSGRRVVITLILLIVVCLGVLTQLSNAQEQEQAQPDAYGTAAASTIDATPPGVEPSVHIWFCQS